MRVLTKTKNEEYIESESGTYGDDSDIDDKDKIISVGYPIKREDIAISVKDNHRFSAYGRKSNLKFDTISAYIRDEKIADSVISRITTEDFSEVSINLPELTKLMCKELFGDNKYALIEVTYFYTSKPYTTYIQIDIEKLCKCKYKSAYFIRIGDPLKLEFRFKSESIIFVSYDYDEKKFKFTINDGMKNRNVKIALLCNTEDELKLFKVLDKTNIK